MRARLVFGLFLFVFFFFLFWFVLFCFCFVKRSDDGMFAVCLTLLVSFPFFFLLSSSPLLYSPNTDTTSAKNRSTTYYERRLHWKTFSLRLLRAAQCLSLGRSRSRVSCFRNTQHNTTQHNTTQHNTTQHNTTQHNTKAHANSLSLFALPQERAHSLPSLIRWSTCGTSTFTTKWF